MSKYRYRYRNNSGSTQRCLAAMKYLINVGKIKYVKGYMSKNNHPYVLVVGENGSSRFNGFYWGYSGEGPRGLIKLLEYLDVDNITIHAVINSSCHTHWKVDLCTN